MNIYPQLSNGAVCHFPFEKTLRYRTIVNLMEDGSRVVLEDPNAAGIQWKLTYSGLTDTEAAGLQTFFGSVAGRLQTFTFFDPSGNLLTWSEDFSQTAWQMSTFLQYQAGTADPLGTQRATTVTNTGSGSLAILQSVAVPGSYLCSFSVYVRSSTPLTIVLTRDEVSQTFSISNTWLRVSLATTTSDAAQTSNFGVTIPVGAQIDIFGMQVEAQPTPSTYIQTLDQSGVYAATRFDSDSLAFTADNPNSNSCEISLYSRLSL
jgi:hypothetical protein